MSGGQDYTRGTFTQPGVVAVVRVAANPNEKQVLLVKLIIYLSYQLNGWFDVIDWIERCQINIIIYVTVSTYSVFNLKSEVE